MIINKRKARVSLGPAAEVLAELRGPETSLKAPSSPESLVQLESMGYAANEPDFEFKLTSDLCRASFADFVQEFWSTIVPEKLIWNWHMQVICDHMQEAAERVFRGDKKKWDYVINVPPGSSKSTITSIMFIAWVWTRMPTARFICCSFAGELALDLSRKCRMVFRSDLYKKCYPEIQFQRDQDTKGHFANTFGGSRVAVGSQGNIMGKHAHFIIIDDPIDPKAVLSTAELASVNNWIKEELSGRKVDKGVSVTFLVMQRLHQDDPAAQMIALPTTKHLCMPATDETNVQPPELRKHYVDGLMDPKRLTRQTLEEIRRGPRGEYVKASQYDQVPAPPGGGMFKTGMIRFGDPPSKFRLLVRFWDKAGTLGGGAYTVGLLMGQDETGRLWVLDVIRVQLDSFAREKLIRAAASRDGRGVIVGFEQEGGSGGKESVESSVRGLLGYRCLAVRPTGDKEARADTFSTQINAGNVWVPVNGWSRAEDGSQQHPIKPQWFDEFSEELRYFPYSTYKDQVDAGSGALTCIVRKSRRVGGVRKSERTDEEKALLPENLLSRKVLARALRWRGVGQ